MDATRISTRRWITLLLLGWLLLSGCSSQGSPTTVESEPAPIDPATPTKEVLPTPTNVPSPEPYASNLSCVGCHTDQEQLISTASQVEEAKPESSGEG